MIVGPFTVNPASQLKPVAVKIADPDEASWQKMMEEHKPLTEAELNKLSDEQKKVQVHALFKVDGKIVAAQSLDGSTYMESNTSLVQAAIDKADASSSSLSRSRADEAAARTKEIEAALRQQYGNRVTVSKMSAGLQMNEGQLMTAIDKQRSNRW